MSDAKTPDSRTARQKIGAAGEDRALLHLQQHGLKLVARNVRYRCGELDLVMLDGNSLVFVEVRKRAASRFGGAGDSLGTSKLARVVAAAHLYLQTNHPRQQPPCRFDVVTIDGPDRLEWLRAAFTAD